MTMTKSTADLLKMLTAALVTVATSYQSITAHIDATIAARVSAAESNITTQLMHHRAALRTHADSLHHEQGRRIDALEKEIRTKRMRTF